MKEHLRLTVLQKMQRPSLHLSLFINIWYCSEGYQNRCRLVSSFILTKPVTRSNFMFRSVLSVPKLQALQHLSFGPLHQL